MVCLFIFSSLATINLFTVYILNFSRDRMCVCSVAQPCPDSVTPRTVACQTPLPMEFSRQEDSSGLPFPSPGDLPDPRIEPESLTTSTLAGRFFTTSTTWEAYRDQMVEIKTSIVFSNWLLSLSNMHFRFLHIFSWLDNYFFLLLNSISLSGCSTIYLSIYLLKDISSASKFWQIWTKWL